MWMARRLSSAAGTLILAASLVVAGACPGASAAEAAAGRPLVYNRFGAPGDGVSEWVHGMYDPAFEIVDVADGDGSYARAHLRSGPPPVAVVEKEIEAEVEVLVVFIITAEGRVTHPVIYRSADPRLSVAALTALARWVFEPARLHGEQVASTAAHGFVFFPMRLSVPEDAADARGAVVP